MPPVGSRCKAPGRGLGGEATQKLTTFFVKVCHLELVLRCMHDYMNQFNMK